MSEEKIPLTLEEKFRVVEMSNKILSQQNAVLQAVRTVEQLQAEFSRIIDEIGKSHNKSGYTIDGNYNLIPPRKLREVN